MKVIEQLVEYLQSQGALDDTQISWLRSKGCIASLEEYCEDHYKDPYDQYDELMPGTLELLEEELLQQADSEKAKLPPRSSKGARRARRKRANLRGAGKQKRDSRRAAALKRKVIRFDLKKHHGIDCLVEALTDDRPSVLIAALNILHQVENSLILSVPTASKKICALFSHSDPGVVSANARLFIKLRQSPDGRRVPLAELLPKDKVSRRNFLRSMRLPEVKKSFVSRILRPKDPPALDQSLRFTVVDGDGECFDFG